MAKIHDYSYRPRLRFFDGLTSYLTQPAKKTVYVGFEVECEAPVNASLNDEGSEEYCLDCEAYDCDCGWRPDSSDDIDIVVGSDEYRWFAKHDSSLNRGAEFVSHPHSFQTWRNHWRQTFAARFRELRNCGWRSWNPGTCGLHMHVSRSAIVSNVHLYRLARIWYAGQCEVEADYELYKALTGRRNNMSYASPNWHDPDGKSHATRLLRDRYYSPRGALNCENGATVELRAFRGTLDTDMAKGSLDLWLLSIDYARTTPVRRCSLSAFISHARNAGTKEARKLIESRVGRKSVTAIRLRAIRQRKDLSRKLDAVKKRQKAEAARLRWLERQRAREHEEFLERFTRQAQEEQEETSEIDHPLECFGVTPNGTHPGLSGWFFPRDNVGLYGNSLDDIPRRDCGCDRCENYRLDLASGVRSIPGMQLSPLGQYRLFNHIHTHFRGE